MAPPEGKLAPSPGGKWAPGAEPLALCMSCNATYAPEFAECPNCHVGLSLVRKCPSCGRIQSAQHVACIYCANSFIQEEGLRPLAAGPISRRRELARKGSRLTVAGVLALALIVGFLLYLQRRKPPAPEVPIGKSYVLRATSMRSKPSLDAPPIKELQPSEIVNITDYTFDEMGNRWFRITEQEISGYVQTQEVAPPKGTEPEKAFELLRHSLLGLDDPAVLSEAEAAVEHYRRIFPASPYVDEVAWLLAERTRQLAERSDQRHFVLASARKQYEKIARGEGEFARRAREALAQLPRWQQGLGSPLQAPPTPLEFSLVGGPSSTSPGSPRTPVRHVAVLSRTPLYVRLTESAPVSPGLTFQGEIDQDIRVNNQVAVPKGSVAHLTFAGGADPFTLSLRLISVVIRDRAYGVSATAVRAELPRGSAQPSPGTQLPPRLPAGSRFEFRLKAALVVTQP